MARSAASCTAGMLHTAKPCFIKTPDDEAAPLHSAMKNFPLRSKYEARSLRSVWWEKWKMRVFLFVIRYYPDYIIDGGEIYYGKIFKQARYAFCWFCGWYIEIGQISERTERNNYLQLNRQIRNQYRSQHSRSAICTWESGFCFWTANCLEGSKWNKLLDFTVEQNKHHCSCRI